MRRTLAIALIFILLPAFAPAQTTPGKTPGQASLKQHLIQLKRDWGRAYVERNALRLEQIMADEYTVTDMEGRISTRAEMMASFNSGEIIYEAASYDDAEVRIYGNVALVSGRGTVKGRNKNGEFHRQYFSTNVFVKRSGRWQAVATHISGVSSLLNSKD